jgi:hypothetical protein
MTPVLSSGVLNLEFSVGVGNQERSSLSEVDVDTLERMPNILFMLFFQHLSGVERNSTNSC